MLIMETNFKLYLLFTMLTSYMFELYFYSIYSSLYFIFLSKTMEISQSFTSHTSRYAFDCFLYGTFGARSSVNGL